MATKEKRARMAESAAWTIACRAAQDSWRVLHGAFGDRVEAVAKGEPNEEEINGALNELYDALKAVEQRGLDLGRVLWQVAKKEERNAKRRAKRCRTS